MSEVALSREHVTTMQRAALPIGMVFQHIGPDNRPRGDVFINMGVVEANNWREKHRALSINVTKGRLTGTPQLEHHVVPLGKAKLKATYFTDAGECQVLRMDELAGWQKDHATNAVICFPQSAQAEPVAYLGRSKHGYVGIKLNNLKEGPFVIPYFETVVIGRYSALVVHA